MRNKQSGTNENGDPVFNQYAICRDCKKQWNLDKQRAKRAAAKKAVREADAYKESPEKEKAQVREAEVKEAVSKKGAPAAHTVSRNEVPTKQSDSGEDETVIKQDPRRSRQARYAAA